jgi:hypothetical protein
VDGGNHSSLICFGRIAIRFYPQQSIDDMTRVTRYRIAYLGLLALLSCAAFFAIRAAGGGPVAVGIAIIVLLLPGRVQAVLLRPLFRGQRDLARGNAERAAREFEAFIAMLERQPWRARALWLGWSLYNPSAKAMGFNNLGVAHERMGNAAAAQEAWRRALALDPLYPVPCANLAALAAADCNAEQAHRWLTQAKQLGYTRGALDQAIHRVQQLLAAANAGRASG